MSGMVPGVLVCDYRDGLVFPLKGKKKSPQRMWVRPYVSLLPLSMSMVTGTSSYVLWNRRGGGEAGRADQRVLGRREFSRFIPWHLPPASLKKSSSVFNKNLLSKKCLKQTGPGGKKKSRLLSSSRNCPTPLDNIRMQKVPTQFLKSIFKVPTWRVFFQFQRPEIRYYFPVRIQRSNMNFPKTNPSSSRVASISASGRCLVNYS